MAFRRWIWVEDTSTGHRMDLDERSLARLLVEGAVRVVEGYPVNEGTDARPRPMKPFLDLADVPAAPPAKRTRKPRKKTAPAAQPAEPTTTTSAEGAE